MTLADAQQWHATWPDAVIAVAVALMVVGLYAAYRFTGGERQTRPLPWMRDTYDAADDDWDDDEPTRGTVR